MLLHRALGSLLHEKRWDDIVVKEILARADVGRSTFYTHFRDKDALLRSGLRDTLGISPAEAQRSTDSVGRVFAFSLPLLEHIERARSNDRTPMAARNYEPLHTALEPALVELISDELRQIAPSRRASAPALPLDLLARHVASTFLLTLEWWVSLEEPRPARDADAMFRTLTKYVVET
ncbi:MAG TPA: TetR/AcrR family transcriptional regulator, partial [Gemmatimonadaceae bacterium]